MLLTSLLSSACSLAVPSAAQKHFASGGDDQHGPTLPASSSSSTFVASTFHPAGVASEALLHQHQPPERKHHGHRRPVDTGHGSSEEAGAEDRHVPDLYNLTLAAMRQYLRNHLNASRLGKTPRKRSHVHVDAVDVEFYRRFKEFNTSQAVLDGATSHLPALGTNSSQQSQDLGTGPTGQGASGPNGPDEPSLAAVTNVTTEPVSPATSASASAAPSGTASQRDYSVLMDDPRGYITASSSFPLRPGKTSTTWNSTFAQHRGYIYGLVSFSVICALVLGLFGVFRCLRATTTTRAEALTLPIQFIADDLAPLNANLNHLPVPMLSVQSPGCAGMERLGVPARGSIGSPPLRNERAGFHHQQQSQQQQPQQQQQQHQQQQQQQHQQQQQQPHLPSQQNHHRHHHHRHHHHHHQQYHQQTSPTGQHLRFGSDLILSSSTSSNFRSNHNQSYLFIPNQTSALAGGGGGGGSSGSNSINYKTHYSNSSYGGSSIGSSTGSSNPITTNFPHCTYHVPLPDGEYGPDRDLQIRTPCQQSEIPRTYVKAPPNKTVRDVPVQYQSTGGITAHGTTMTAAVGSNSHVNSMVDLAGYYGGAKTIGRPGDGGRLAATAPGPSLGGQPKSVDKLQKILRFLPGKATKSSTPPSSSSSSASSSSSSSSSSSASSSSSSGIKSASNNINNNHQGASTSFGGGLQPPAHSGGVLPGSHSSSTSSLNNNSGSSSSSTGSGTSNNSGVGGIASGSVISSISGSYGPNSVSNSIGCSNHVNNNRVGCGNAGGNIRVDGRGGLSLATAGAGIHNHNQHYRSPPVAVSSLGSPTAATLSSPTSSSSSSSSSSCSGSSPLASTVARQSGVDVIVPGSTTATTGGSGVSGSSSDPGHAPFTI